MSVTSFNGRAASPIGPAQDLVAVTPDDTADLPDGIARGLFVGGGGAVTVMVSSGRTVTLRSADSQYHPVKVRRVLLTGTEAIEIIALY
jgi:hypothetical protein